MACLHIICWLDEIIEVWPLTLTWGAYWVRAVEGGAIQRRDDV